MFGATPGAASGVAPNIRACFLVGRKRPCGSALGRTELKQYMFYVFETQASRCFCSDISYIINIIKKSFKFAYHLKSDF